MQWQRRLMALLLMSGLYAEAGLPRFGGCVYALNGRDRSGRNASGCSRA